MRLIMHGVTAALLALACGGCMVAGALLSKTVGDPKNPADYQFGKDNTTAVLVEDYQNPGLHELESERLERDLVADLKENKAGTFVDPQKVDELKSREPAKYQKMTLPEIARDLGAKKVLYVNLAEFKAEPPPGSDIVHGYARAYVKVVDAQSGRTLWPPDTSAGREIKLETPDIKELETQDKTDEKLYQRLTQKIATLFYASPAEMKDGTEMQ